MSLENLENLTDVELRRKLIEYDFPSVPITETSRGFLLKKLKNHIKNLKSRKHSPIRYVTPRAKEELEHFPAETNELSHRIRVSDSPPVIGMKLSVSSDSDTQGADQLNQPVPITSHEHNRRIHTQYTNQKISTLSNNSSHEYLSKIWNVFDLQENYTNSVWWGFTLFLLVITFMYMVKTSDLSKYVTEGNTNYVLCDKLEPAGPLLQPPFLCVDKERLEPALAIVRNLIVQLQAHCERHYCYDHKQPEAMSVTEFIKSMFEEGNMVDMRNVRAAQYLITCNPQWKIDMIDPNGAPAIFNGFDKILSNQNTFLVLRQINLPLACSLLLKAHRFMSFIGHIAFLMFVFLMVFLTFCYVRRIQQQHFRDVQHFMNRIVEELRQRAADTGNPAGRDLIENHFRDQLIPVSKRKCKLKLWNEALRELEENDSRIQFDVTLRDGEEFRTMRWMGNASQAVDGGVAGESDIATEVETNC